MGTFLQKWFILTSLTAPFQKLGLITTSCVVTSLSFLNFCVTALFDAIMKYYFTCMNLSAGRIPSLRILLLSFQVLWNIIINISPTPITNPCSIASLHLCGLRPPVTKAAKCRGAKNSWAQPWGSESCDWLTQIGSRALDQSEARVTEFLQK